MLPRVAVFAFTSCEGCSLMILSLEDELPNILGQVELVNFREAIDAKSDDYDIAIIDGAITREKEIEELKKIRAKAKVLVAMGACAVQGGLYGLKNFHDPVATGKYVYGDMARHFDTLPARPVSHYVTVDHNIYGCPISKGEFVEVLHSIMLGKRPYIPDYPLCNECRTAENICVFDRGGRCFGPVTRAGCGAICPAHNTGCCGCRGLVDKPFIESHRNILMEHGMTPAEIAAWYREFNGYLEENERR